MIVRIDNESRVGRIDNLSNQSIKVVSGEDDVLVVLGENQSFVIKKNNVEVCPVKNYSAKTSSYTLTTSDGVVDCTSGTFNITLPSAVNITGREYTIKNTGTGVITLLTTNSETIDDNASGSLILYQYDALTVFSDGANWIII